MSKYEDSVDDLKKDWKYEQSKNTKKCNTCIYSSWKTGFLEDWLSCNRLLEYAEIDTEIGDCEVIENFTCKHWKHWKEKN